MIKIPREQSGIVYNAGQYMISELNKMLDKKIEQLPQDSEIVQLIQKIEKIADNRAIRDIISDRFNRARTGGRYTSNNQNINRDGRLYYSNGTNDIELNLNSDSVLINEQNLKDNSSISIDEMFEKTNGSISFSRAQNASQFVQNLAIAQRKTVELSNVLKLILNDSELDSVIEEIAQKSIAINDRIITRNLHKHQTTFNLEKMTILKVTMKKTIFLLFIII